MNYALTEIFDIDALQNLFTSISNLNGTALAIIDLDGVMHVSSGFTIISPHFHKENPETLKMCYHNETVLSSVNKNRKYEVYTCQNGMTDVVMPVVTNSKHICNLLTGQFFFDKPNIEYFKQQAKKQELDEEEYLHALQQVPIITKNELKKRIAFLTQLTQIIAELAYKNQQNRNYSEQLKKSKEQAEELSERFEYATSIGKVGTWDWNLLTDELIWSTETYRILGYEPFSVTPGYELFLNLVHPDDRQFLNDSVNAAWNEQKPYSVDCRILIGEQNTRICNATGKVEYNSKGKPVRMIGTFQDITDRKKTEMRLKESNNELKKAKEESERNEKRLKISQIASNAGAWDWDIVNNTFYWPEELITLFGFNPKDPFGFDTWRKSLHPDDLEQADKKVLEAIDNHHDLISEYRIIKPDKTIKWIRTYGKTFYENNIATRMIGMCIDITAEKETEFELKQARKKAEESETKYRNLVENTPDFIYTFDLESRHTMVNESVCNALQLDFKDIIGKNHIELGFPEDIADEWRKMHLEVINTGKEYKTETATPMPDGTTKTYEVILTPIFDDSKNVLGIRGISRDISVQKKYQEDLLIAKEKAEEANRLKSEFLKNMSHEIRTPMNGIIGFSEMLDEPGTSVEKRKYYSKIVQNSSKQLLKIIDDILEISTLETKQEKVNESEFSLNDLLMELFSIFNLTSKEQNVPIYLKKALHDTQSNIISDKIKLNKILSNLLENALKFTHEGFIEFGYNIEDNNLVLFVKDTGIGISPKNQETIFERFSQEEKDVSHKYGGLGLGLSISKENSLLLGGKIYVESEKGKGSVFYVSIPYKTSNEKNTRFAETTKEEKHDHYTILIAEDEEVNFLYIEALYESLLTFKYEIIHAKNGKEALDICLINNGIDLVLMDVKMPVLNGYEATEKIKSKRPDLPVIAQTAYSTQYDKELALKHGCDDFISKPIDKDDLFELTLKYLKIKQSEI